MKKSIFARILVLVVILYFVGCNQKQSQPENQRQQALTFSVTSDGRQSAQVLQDLLDSGYAVKSYAKVIIDKSSSTITTGKSYDLDTTGRSYDLEIVLPSNFSDSERTTENIIAYAKARGMVSLPNKTALLALTVISVEQLKKLNLYALVFMHEPIKTLYGDLYRLGLSNFGRWLDVYATEPGRKWSREEGFVFLRP